jgi:hypothetical protein
VGTSYHSVIFLFFTRNMPQSYQARRQIRRLQKLNVRRTTVVPHQFDRRHGQHACRAAVLVRDQFAKGN